MGVCASCLGLNRHPSHEHETDELLQHDQTISYGATDIDDATSIRDEEDVRRERDALEHISTKATDNMIDILHAQSTEDGTHLTPNLSHLSLHVVQQDSAERLKEHGEPATEDAEQAWLKEISARDTDQDVVVKGSYSRNLTIDLSSLRDDGQTSRRREL